MCTKFEKYHSFTVITRSLHKNQFKKAKSIEINIY